MDTFRQLECFLNEFYHQTTTNQRKREIEKCLKAFQTNDESWKLCIQYSEMANNNVYLWFFIQNTLEV